ncbi:UDP-N-acetylmuramoyl-L-alanine--D-glutamate ligase [Candidatus Peregrinibacteria bacterium]|nr:UDP-N-acetylmuramoyl-L-alanine--D-glutamate ligase [Candidatus Peregrinibacteria bacterium]
MQFKSPIAILGFGVEGQYAAEFLKKQGARDVTVLDQKENPAAFDDLSRFGAIIRSPGVRYNLPGIVLARQSGALVTSMTQLALEAANRRITAITGSNGKTTTTALIAAILRAHYGEKLIIGGNDGQPVLQEVLDHPDWPVLLEVSSFQFADVTISPHIAAVLNITPNHLDWHADLEDYIHAKNNLIRHQRPEDWCVLNANDENSRKLAAEAPSCVFWVGEKKENHYAVWEGDSLVVRHGGDPFEVTERGRLKAKTHPDNFLFAAAVASLHQVPIGVAARQMENLTGIPQRLEFVREIDGVSFYNDSSCTTPESAEIAIENFPQGKLILMLGGSSKSADFSFLASKIVGTDVRVYLYGLEGERIKKAIEKTGGAKQILTYNTSKDFRQIVEDVYHQAKQGDNVVLSPATASFDMFKNSKERGELFNQFVNDL